MWHEVKIRILPFISLFAFVYNLFTDLWFEIEVSKRCHGRIATAILFFSFAPGWIKMFYKLPHRWKDWEIWLKFIFGPVFFISNAFKWHTKKLIDPTDEIVRKKSKAYRLAEFIYQTVPQIIVNLLLMISVQIRTTASYVSLSASLLVVIWAFQTREPRPLHKVWFILANLIDIVFRILTLTLCFVVVWGGGVWFDFVYTIITIPILKWHIYKGERFLTILQKASQFFLVSGYNYDYDSDRKFRFISKMVFNLLAAGVMVYTQVCLMGEPESNVKDDCENICDQDKMPDYCADFNLQNGGKQKFMNVLYGLLIWSLIEGILERFTPLAMPYRLLPKTEVKKPQSVMNDNQLTSQDLGFMSDPISDDDDSSD